MPEPGPPNAVPVPVALIAKVRRDLTEVRMGVYLASVRLNDGRVVEPVAINGRPSLRSLTLPTHRNGTIGRRTEVPL